MTKWWRLNRHLNQCRKNRINVIGHDVWHYVWNNVISYPNFWLIFRRRLIRPILRRYKRQMPRPLRRKIRRRFWRQMCQVRARSTWNVDVDMVLKSSRVNSTQGYIRHPYGSIKSPCGSCMDLPFSVKIYKNFRISFSLQAFFTEEKYREIPILSRNNNKILEKIIITYFYFVSPALNRV